MSSGTDHMIRSWHFQSYPLTWGKGEELEVEWITSGQWFKQPYAQGWCTGMTQRDGMEREVGGGFRMGNTCTPVADSCWCMPKPVQYCKVISLQLKYINLYFKKEKKYLCNEASLNTQRTVFRELLDWEAHGGLRGEGHTSSTKLLTPSYSTLLYASLLPGCSWIISCYNKPVI